MKWLMALLALVAVGSALAHPLAPSLLELEEVGGGPAHKVEGETGAHTQVRVRWKTPLMQPSGAALEPVLPTTCRVLEPPVAVVEGSGAVVRWMADCGPDGLTGAELCVVGLERSGTDALVRVQLADGRVLQTLLTGAAPRWRVPLRQTSLEVGVRYLVMGLEHLLTGTDHLLMVLGLLCLVRGRRTLLLTLTAFTAGHSITLALAALRVVWVPAALVEPAIAGTLLLLGLELAGAGGPTRRPRNPWRMALLFGLLHGLGFAGALLEAGLPAGAVPFALLAFNCGIEAGQLLVVVALLGAWRLLEPTVSRLPPRLAPRLALAPAYTIGALASYWIFERTAAWF